MIGTTCAASGTDPSHPAAIPRPPPFTAVRRRVDNSLSCPDCSSESAEVRRKHVRNVEVGGSSPLTSTRKFAGQGRFPPGLLLDDTAGTRVWVGGLSQPDAVAAIAGALRRVSRRASALARAAKDTSADLLVTAPMVATPDEAASFAARVRDHGLPIAGAMVEVPAAAGLQARVRLWRSCKRSAFPQSCLGVTSLSMAASSVAEVRSMLAERTFDSCKAAAELALAASSPASGRAAVRGRW